MNNKVATITADALRQAEAEKPKPEPLTLKATDKIGITIQQEGNITVVEGFNKT